MNRPVAVRLLVISVLLLCGLAAADAVEHVVVVGVDGMTASSVTRAKTPNMHEIMAGGAHTLSARSVDPSVSSPNWASILMGAPPDKHGIWSNDWKPGDTPAFPTIFGVCRAARPDADIAAVYEWLGFGRLFKRSDVTINRNPKSWVWQTVFGRKTNAHMAAKRAAEFIRERKPLLTFVHLDLVDHAGHSEGYDSIAYDEAVGVADGYVGQIYQAVRDAGMLGKTAFFVVSDHGGKDKGHGGKTDEEMTVPWMVIGPGVAKGRELPGPVSVAQTAPTIAMLLGLKAPEQWTETAVKGTAE